MRIVGAVASLLALLAWPYALRAQQVDRCAELREAKDVATARKPNVKPQIDRGQYEQKLQSLKAQVGGKTPYQLEVELKELRWSINGLEQKIAKVESQLSTADLYDRDKAALKEELKERTQELEAKQARVNDIQKLMPIAEEAGKYEAPLDALERWEVWEKATQDYDAFEAEMKSELAAATTTFEARRVQFNRQWEDLRGRPKPYEQATLDAMRALKNETLSVFKTMKSDEHLGKFTCWPQVADFVVKKLDSAIFKLEQFKVALPSEAEDDTDPYDLTIEGGGTDAVAGDWAGVWVRRTDNWTVTISGGATGLTASTTWQGPEPVQKDIGQWSCGEVVRNAAQCTWTSSYEDGCKTARRSGTLGITLRGDHISGSMEDTNTTVQDKPDVACLPGSIRNGAVWPIELDRRK